MIQFCKSVEQCNNELDLATCRQHAVGYMDTNSCESLLQEEATINKGDGLFLFWVILFF